MLSYPDASATRMTFYHVERATGKWYKLTSLDLKEHDFLNLSYYLDADFAPLWLRPRGGEEVAPLNIETTYGYRSKNELYVSEVNNPLVFPDVNRITTGNGRIMNMSTNVMNAGEENYGQFPLYVFSEGGVYTLRTGEGNIPYGSVSQPAYADAPVSDVVCATPLGVVFAVRRGLAFINGENIRLLTPSLEETPEGLHLEESAGITDGLYAYGRESFTEYIKKITSITYNNRYNEIIVSDSARDFSWSLPLDNLCVFQTTNRQGKAVKNAFPESYNFLNGEVFDIQTGEGSADVCMITRALRFGTGDIKKLERMILRGLIYGVNDRLYSGSKYPPFTGIQYSNDGRNFLFSRGLNLKKQNFNGIDTGMLARQQFREYVLLFAARVDGRTKIRYLDAEVMN
jgi:hypothetical protein